MRTLFCDIQGTLVQDGKILRGADKALQFYQEQSWIIIGISNNIDSKSLESAVNEIRHTLELFPQILCAYLCPDPSGEECYFVHKIHSTEVGITSKYKGLFHKPQPGMLLHALEVHDGEKERAWHISDRPEDEEAATNAGIHFMTADLWRDRFTTGVYTI